MANQSYAQVLNKSKFAKRKEPKSRSSQNLLSKCLDVPNFKILEQDEIEEYDSSMSQSLTSKEVTLSKIVPELDRDPEVPASQQNPGD